MSQKPTLSVKLPSIPRVAMRLLGVLPNPNASTAEIVGVVQTDPAIAAKILKTANSPAFGGGRNIDSLDRAVVWMGRQAITCLALSFSLSEKVREGGALNAYYKDYWLQSVIQALAMECLSKRVDHRIRHAAFVTGLLVDIGRLALLQSYAARYTRLVDQARVWPNRLADVEQSDLGKTHAEISAELLTAWSLPEAMVAAARDHEMSADQIIYQENSEHFPLIAAASVAAATSDFLIGINPIVPFRRLETLTSKIYGFSEGQLHDYVGDVNERLRATSEMLSADLSDLPSTTDILACAMGQLSALSLQSLTDAPPADQRGDPARDDVSELRAKLYELEKRTCVDPLTGVYTRGYFRGRLAQRLRQAGGDPVPMGVLYGDIDGFKRLNETYGRAAGDEVLKTVGGILRACVGSDDVVAREGGDEFVILAEVFDSQVLEGLAERIRLEVAGTTFCFGEHAICATISLGGVLALTRPADCEAAHQDALLSTALEAVSECRRRGGDAVAIRVCECGTRDGAKALVQ